MNGPSVSLPYRDSFLKRTVTLLAKLELRFLTFRLIFCMSWADWEDPTVTCLLACQTRRQRIRTRSRWIWSGRVSCVRTMPVERMNLIWRRMRWGDKWWRPLEMIWWIVRHCRWSSWPSALRRTRTTCKESRVCWRDSFRKHSWRCWRIKKWLSACVYYLLTIGQCQLIAIP